MQLIGNLKKQVEKTNSKAEAKELIKNAGMILTDDELEMVSGGSGDPDPSLLDGSIYIVDECTNL